MFDQDPNEGLIDRDDYEKFLVMEDVRRIRTLAEAVCKLPDAACVTTAKNSTVCDYLSATNAETILRVLSFLLPNPEGSLGGTEAAVTSQPLSSAAQVNPLVGRCLPFPEYLKGG